MVKETEESGMRNPQEQITKELGMTQSDQDNFVAKVNQLTRWKDTTGCSASMSKSPRQ